MKLLDPMAGIKLASGHPLFHIAQFVASWIALFIGRNEPAPTPEVQIAFKMLQWSHFTNFMLKWLSGYAKKKSKMPENLPLVPFQNDGSIESFKASQKIIARDGSWLLFSRVLDTLAVFLYQGVVFYA